MSYTSIQEKRRAAAARSSKRIEETLATAEAKIEALLDHERELDSTELRVTTLLAQLSEGRQCLEAVVENIPTVEGAHAIVRDIARHAINTAGITYLSVWSRANYGDLAAPFAAATHRDAILAAVDGELMDELFGRLQQTLEENAAELKELGLSVAVSQAIASEKKRRAEAPWRNVRNK